MIQALRSKVDARDSLIERAERSGAEAHGQALEALRRGDLVAAESALRRHDVQVRDLVENLRIYQAELRAQADELAASQARTEQALRGFATLFTQMPVAVLRVAMNGEVVDHNARARDLFKLSPGVVRARFLHRLVATQDYQDTVRPAFHEVLSTGATVIDSVGLLTERGQPFEGELHIAAIPSDAHDVPHFACAVIDRTEHLENLRALSTAVDSTRRSEAFLADSARLAHIGGWEYTVESGRLRWSKEMCALLEVGEDFVPTIDAALDFCLPASRPMLRGALEAAVMHGKPFELELDMSSRRGRPMRVLAFGHADMEGALCKRVTGVCQDITSQHRARQQIGDLTERLNMAHDAGGIGVWDWDLPGQKLFLDGRMARLLGAPGPALAESCLDPRSILRDRLDAEDAQRFDEAIDRAVKAREPLSLEVRLIQGPGGVRFLHLTGRAQYDDAGRPLRLVGCAWDCTTEKEAARLLADKESAELASRSKSAFLSRMSHELRTPLNAIMGFSQLMRLEAAAGDMVVKPHRVAFIETAARHLLDLINEVLDVSRIESGHVVVTMTRVDLCTIVEECLPMVAGAADQAGLSIDRRIFTRGPQWVRCDRLRLKEVVINLLSNAVKYNRPGGRIDIDAQRIDGRIVLSVADTGIGLDVAQREGLFQPFNRLGAEALGIEGSGMGLFVSKRFVELMGGSIGVDSRPGVGTRFAVSLEAAPSGE